METEIAMKPCNTANHTTRSNKQSRIGRPTLYSEEIAERICFLISEGHSLVRICKRPELPSRRTVMNWMGNNPSFCTRLAQARDLQAEAYAEEIIAIADTCTDPKMARLRIDARKWYAAKLAPRKYGDKLDLTTRNVTPPVTRDEMIAKMRKSSAFLVEIEGMVAEARISPSVGG